MGVTASAPGKVILVGEHFVVENEPAIAVAVDLRARVIVEPRGDDKVFISSRELGVSAEYGPNAEAGGVLAPVYAVVREVFNNVGVWRGVSVRVESDIPPASGMGSSAAVAVATAAAVSGFLGLRLGLDEVSQIAYKAEKIVHGTPSGIDNTVSTYGGAIAFRRLEGFIPLEADFTGYRLVLADSGIPRRTGDLVARVRALKARYPSVMEPLYHAAGRLAIEAGKAIQDGDFARLGELMNVNHGMLSAIGVSNHRLEQLVYAAREAGALGAKITGAGGGGFIVALVSEEKACRVAEKLKPISSRVFTVEVSRDGVRVE